MMRCQGTANSLGPAGHGDRHLASQVEPGEIIVVLLRDAQAVPQEYERRLDLGCEVEQSREGRVFAEDERLGLSVTHQRGVRIVFDGLPCLELDGLVVAVSTGGSETGFA